MDWLEINHLNKKNSEIYILLYIQFTKRALDVWDTKYQLQIMVIHVYLVL